MQILPFKFFIFNSAYHVRYFLVTLSAHRFSNMTFMSSVIMFCLLSFRNYISIFNAEKVFMLVFSDSLPSTEILTTYTFWRNTEKPSVTD